LIFTSAPVKRRVGILYSKKFGSGVLGWFLYSCSRRFGRMGVSSYQPGRQASLQATLFVKSVSGRFSPMETKFVYSSPKRLHWFQWVIIVVQSAGVLFLGWLFHIISSGDPYNLMGSFQFALVFLFYFGIWYHSAFAMLRKQPVLEYSGTHIVGMGKALYVRSQPLAFSDLSRAIRRSETCLCLGFKTPIAIDLAFPASWLSRDPKARLKDEFEFEANEEDIDQFSAQLTRAGVNVVPDPIPDNDPLKQYAILAIGILSIFAAMALSMAWIIKVFK
jgi:hypothetical protein